MAASSSDDHAARLTSELADLRARQDALLPQLRHRNLVEQGLLDEVDALFAKVPEYTAKAAQVQRAMEALKDRTASMRARCERLHGEAGE